MITKATLEIGLHRSHQRPLEGSHEINVVRGGPGQLLSWVEVHLGINGPDIPWTNRVVQYHASLGKLPHSSYARSFESDGWATAAHLLKRRDQLLLHGWDQSSTAGIDLVDALANLDETLLPPGIPDRIRVCLEWLEVGAKLPAHVVHLDEAPSHWPALWQSLLKHLTTEIATSISPTGSGALGQIQGNLLHETTSAIQIDPTAIALRTASRHSAIQFLARWMRERHCTVYCPDETLATMLDSALHADGQPTMGATRESRGQPAQQILPLVVQLLWEPVNPYVLLDFLLLPVGPVKSIGWKLAQALEKQPGYQSDAWNEAIEELLEDDEDGKKAEKLAKWLDHDRLPLGHDLPTNLVEHRCGLVAQWTSGRAEWEAQQDDPDESLVAALRSASSQASALGKLAAQMGGAISEAQLTRLLDEVRSEACTEQPHPPQAGGSIIVSTLADVRDCDHLVWLGTHAPEPSRNVWTPNEVERLRGAGIDLNPSLDSTSLRAAEACGLARAKQMLVIDVEAAEGRRHPLWLRVHGDLEIQGKRRGELPLLEDILANQDLVATRLVEPRIAPDQRVEWIAGGPIPIPEYTSATAIEAQLTCPLKWTLRDALRIRPSRVANIPEDARLKGNFAHELLEEVFTAGAPPSPEEAERRMATVFDELLPRNAATLAIPRKLAERTRFRSQLTRAARQFATSLREGGYEVVGIEVDTQGEVGGLPLKGSIDCVLRGKDGEAIVDFKFGGAAKHEAKLIAGRALQLATYAQDRQADQGAAYFVLANNRIITPHGGGIRGATKHVDGPDVLATWQRMQDALRSTTEWLHSGDVVARPMQHPEAWPSGSNVGLDAEKPEAACSYCDYGLLCGREALQ